MISMKWIHAWFFFSFALALQGEGPMRVWTSPEGRTMKAAFLKFDGEKAVFKKQDGSSFSLSPSVFSLEDRAILMNLKTSAEVAASSVTESVDFAIGATIVLSVRGEASVVDPPRLSRNRLRGRPRIRWEFYSACLHLPRAGCGLAQSFLPVRKSGLGRIPRSRCSSVTELLPRLEQTLGWRSRSFNKKALADTKETFPVMKR